MIFVMGITMLKMDRAKAKWRVKLQKAFDGQRGAHEFPIMIQSHVLTDPRTDVDKRTRSGRWVLFLLPMITVLREGTWQLYSFG